MTRNIKTFLKRTLYAIFVNLQKFGISVLPNHFYSQIPYINQLKTSNYWKNPLSMNGILGKEIEEQSSFFSDLFVDYSNKISISELHNSCIKINGEDGGYGMIEAGVLYYFILKNRPAKVIQIGCGVSTAVILTAANAVGYCPEIVCIEPFPSPYLISLNKENKITLIKEKAQLVDMHVLKNLNKGDLLFIDSTHTVKAGSEVNRIILEVLPLLGQDIWIHFHDINFPYDYTRDILCGDMFFWLESTLLYSFLLKNNNFRIAFSLSMLHYSKQELLKKYLPEYLPQKDCYGLLQSLKGHFPSSIYLKSC